MRPSLKGASTTSKRRLSVSGVSSPDEKHRVFGPDSNIGTASGNKLASVGGRKPYCRRYMVVDKFEEQTPAASGDNHEITSPGGRKVVKKADKKVEGMTGSSLISRGNKKPQPPEAQDLARYF